MPRLSVIVTTFNIDAYIAQCLDSVIAQTLKHIEVIVVDDGSTDGTRSIIEQYAQRDPRISPVLLEQNSPGGVATAANAGLARATAPYVGFMDGDDYCEPTMFERLLVAAEQHDTDLAMCSFRLVDATTGKTAPAPDSHLWSYLHSSHYVLDAASRRRLLDFNAVPWRKVYRTEMLNSENLRFPVGDYFYEDNPFHWFALLSARSIALVPEVLCYHRMEREGQSMVVADARLLRIFDHHWTIHSFLVERGLLDLYAPNLVSWVIRQAGWIATRTPPESRRDLFDRLHAILEAYEPYVFREGLSLSPRGTRVTGVARAARRGNYEAFCRFLDEGVAADADSGATPLRAAENPGDHEAPSRLRAATRRFSALARRGRRTTQEPPEATSDPITIEGGPTVSGTPSIDTTDLMFALVVLQRRLGAAEAEIREMRATLAGPDTLDGPS